MSGRSSRSIVDTVIRAGSRARDCPQAPYAMWSHGRHVIGQRREGCRQPGRVVVAEPTTEQRQPDGARRVRDDRLEQDRRGEEQVLVEAEHDVGDVAGSMSSCGPNRRAPAQVVATAAATSMVVGGTTSGAANRALASATRRG